MAIEEVAGEIWTAGNCRYAKIAKIRYSLFLQDSGIGREVNAIDRF